jgi:V/A-type H+-transporting ATPase subunit E
MDSNENLDALIERVLAKARDAATAMTERAEQAAERELGQAEEQAAKRLAAAEAVMREAALERQHAVQAEVQQEERRAVMNAREAAVESVFVAALEQLVALDDRNGRRALLIRLVGEGIEAIGTDSVRVRLNVADQAVARDEAFPKEIGGVPLTIDDETIVVSGGPVVSDAAGRVVFENTFEARLERARAGLRRQIAGMLNLCGGEGVQ